MRSATLVPYLRSKTQISAISFEDRLLVQRVTFCCDTIKGWGKGLRHLFIKLETTSDLIALLYKPIVCKIIRSSVKGGTVSENNSM